MSEMGGTPGWRQAPGWMKLLLIVSLSVNVAIGGLIGGNAIRQWQHGIASGKWQNEPGLDRRQTRILRMVPDARREEARTILLARQDEVAAARETMRAAQQALVEAIRQDPLDPDRLAAALAERRAASGRMWGIGYEQMAEIVLRLDAAERAELAKRLEERTRRWMERQERKGR
ncbi:MAG: periplasmic heavy metal sensor [Proteobacteria bacterium]|nr:periplasmic heavy metal sensor [Pseudomonadota bacterium]